MLVVCLAHIFKVKSRSNRSVHIFKGDGWNSPNERGGQGGGGGGAKSPGPGLNGARAF